MYLYTEKMKNYKQEPKAGKLIRIVYLFIAEGLKSGGNVWYYNRSEYFNGTKNMKKSLKYI